MTDAHLAFDAFVAEARIRKLEDQLEEARAENELVEQERDMWRLRAEEQANKADHWRHRYEIATGRGGK